MSLKRKLLGCGMWPRLPEGAAVCFPAGPHQRGPSFSEGWRETVISLVRLKFPGSSWSAESPALDLRGIQAPRAGSGAWRSALGSGLSLSVLMRGPLPPPRAPHSNEMSLRNLPQSTNTARWKVSGHCFNESIGMRCLLFSPNFQRHVLVHIRVSRAAGLPCSEWDQRAALVFTLVCFTG